MNIETEVWYNEPCILRGGRSTVHTKAFWCVWVFVRGNQEPFSYTFKTKPSRKQISRCKRLAVKEDTRKAMDEFAVNMRAAIMDALRKGMLVDFRPIQL